MIADTMIFCEDLFPSDEFFLKNLPGLQQSWFFNPGLAISVRSVKKKYADAVTSDPSLFPRTWIVYRVVKTFAPHIGTLSSTIPGIPQDPVKVRETPMEYHFFRVNFSPRA